MKSSALFKLLLPYKGSGSTFNGTHIASNSQVCTAAMLVLLIAEI
jgi:hypothetical protein